MIFITIIWIATVTFNRFTFVAYCCQVWNNDVGCKIQNDFYHSQSDTVSSNNIWRKKFCFLQFFISENRLTCISKKDFLIAVFNNCKRFTLVCFKDHYMLSLRETLTYKECDDSPWIRHIRLLLLHRVIWWPKIASLKLQYDINVWLSNNYLPFVNLTHSGTLRQTIIIIFLSHIIASVVIHCESVKRWPDHAYPKYSSEFITLHKLAFDLLQTFTCY